MAAATYRAYQALGGGRLELVDRPVEAPAAGMVRVAVEACGVCHTDVLTVEGGFPGMTYPRVPGHEAVGRVDALGAGVTRWKLGQRVGVGFLAGRCGECPSCRRGDFVNCANQAITGLHLDGGYAEMMVASQHALVAIPDALQSADAAPLQCAGVTTFNALRKSVAKPGDLVAVQGVGGLGHLAIQFADHMGFRTVAIARGADKKELALSLGADHYIDSAARIGRRKRDRRDRVEPGDLWCAAGRPWAEGTIDHRWRRSRADDDRRVRSVVRGALDRGAEHRHADRDRGRSQLQPAAEHPRQDRAGALR